MNMLLEMLKFSCAVNLDVALVTAFEYSFKLYMKNLSHFSNVGSDVTESSERL